MSELPVTIAILTYNRPKLLEQQLQRLSSLQYSNLDVVVVDNKSDVPVNGIVDGFSFARLVQMPENLGVGARNQGIKAAEGEIVITLDDDVSGITDDDINSLISIFKDDSIGAVCFKVLDEQTGEIINWCHHRKIEEYSDTSFITDEITEGAVAFRKKLVIEAGLYPDYFFISHEGPDLALRIMNLESKVIYSPEVEVHHSHSTLGRASWRRYYYDSRNLIWLVIRNYPVIWGVKKLFIGLSAMFVYSLRDGFIKYWFKGIFDGLLKLPEVFKQRSPIKPHARLILEDINQHRPSIWHMIKIRLFRRKVQI